MAGKSKAISDDLLLKCQEALKRQGKEGEIGRRLQAIISAKTHGITKVAEVYGITRATLMRWIKFFEQGKEQGLVIKQGRGRKRLLSTEKAKAMLKIIKEKPNATTEQFMEMAKTKFNIKVSRSTMYRIIKRLGFSYITPRASHYLSNGNHKDDFKKKS
jgi:transposase